MVDALDRLLDELQRQPRHDPGDEHVRLAVRLRARDACEYCLLPTGGQFHLEHIIPSASWPTAALAAPPPEQLATPRSGPDHLDHYAWACPFCNQHKGRRVQARHGRQLSRLFDPRQDVWPAHFALTLRGLFIVGLDAVGQVTTRVLGFNDSALDGPLAARALALFEGRFPPVWARPWLADPDR